MDSGWILLDLHRGFGLSTETFHAAHQAFHQNHRTIHPLDGIAPDPHPVFYVRDPLFHPPHGLFHEKQGTFLLPHPLSHRFDRRSMIADAPFLFRQMFAGASAIQIDDAPRMADEAMRPPLWARGVGNGFLTLLSNIFTDLNLTDMETCYKAFRREIIQSISIEENRFGFEPEITAKVARKKCRIYEVGISYYGRTYSEGKKIGWKDGARAIWCILKYNMFKVSL